MMLEDLFNDIEEYHKKLKANPSMNEIILALHHEVSELGESYPWKPWRPKNYKKVDIDNMLEEIVDILFFLGSILELNNIYSVELEYKFIDKLRTNYQRIEEGYNETN